MSNLFNSVKKKMNASFILLSLFCVVISVVTSLYLTKKVAEGQMAADGTTIANVAYSSIKGYTLQDSKEKINDTFKNILNSSKGEIIYISIVNKNYKLAAHTDISMIDKEVQKAEFKDAVEGGKTIANIYTRITGDKVFNVTIPYYENAQLVGGLNVALSLRNMNRLIKDNMILFSVVGIILLIVSIMLGAILSKVIVKPLEIIRKRLATVKKGDFTVVFHAKSSDEIGELMNTLNFVMEEIRNVIIKIKGAAVNLKMVSENMAAAEEEVAQSSEEITNAISQATENLLTQTSHVEETNVSIENLAQSIDDIYLKVEDVFKSSNKIKSSADVGARELEELTQSVSEIREEYKTTEDRVLSLNENVAKISAITEVINHVAGQTNLLALNAAIEAARAGEAGKGFSVVAEEIRKLAEQVLESSKDITNLINTVIENAENVSQLTNTVSSKMTNQIKSIDGTVASFKEILDEIKGISPHIDGVHQSLNKASTQKNTLLEKSQQIEKTAVKISSASEEIAASTEEQNNVIEELSASSQELNAMAEELVTSVLRFKVE